MIATKSIQLSNSLHFLRVIMGFYQVYMVDLESGHVFWNVPKWNMELSKWEGRGMMVRFW